MKKNNLLEILVMPISLLIWIGVLTYTRMKDWEEGDWDIFKDILKSIVTLNFLDYLD